MTPLAPKASAVQKDCWTDPWFELCSIIREIFWPTIGQQEQSKIPIVLQCFHVLPATAVVTTSCETLHLSEAAAETNHMFV